MLCVDVLYRGLLELNNRMNYPKESSYSQVGKVPKTKSIRSVALYDANDGTILHMHHVMTMEGCEPRDMVDIENDTVRFAKKLGHNVENLKILRAPDSINPFAKYRINLANLEFVELPNPFAKPK
jgi:hypothetical protein